MTEASFFLQEIVFMAIRMWKNGKIEKKKKEFGKIEKNSKMIPRN